jgi:hypothetical protein
MFFGIMPDALASAPGARPKSCAQAQLFRFLKGADVRSFCHPLIPVDH